MTLEKYTVLPRLTAIRFVAGSESGFASGLIMKAIIWNCPRQFW